MVELYEAGVDYIPDILCQSDVGVSEEDLFGESSEKRQNALSPTDTD